MTGSIKNVLVAASISSSVLGFVAWRVYATKTQSVPQYEIVKDRSWSHTNGYSSLLGLAEQIVKKEPAASTSQLTILITGDRTTANEPLRLAKYFIPRSRKAIEGRGAGLRRQQELLADLQEKCQSLHSTNISPIFLSVTEALADLRAQGCKPDSGCRLYVDSDGEENIDKDIKQALNAGLRKRHNPPARVDNAGIQVVFCGLAATSSGQDLMHSRASLSNPRWEDRLRLTWRSQFIVPEAVDFEPYCPTSSTLNEHR